MGSITHFALLGLPFVMSNMIGMYFGYDGLKSRSLFGSLSLVGFRLAVYILLIDRPLMPVNLQIVLIILIRCRQPRLQFSLRLVLVLVLVLWNQLRSLTR